jgi:hypothetical protein
MRVRNEVKSSQDAIGAPSDLRSEGTMKHAGATALRELEELLAGVRRRDGLIERKLGIFYRRSRSFLHFHEDPEGLFADLRVDDEFKRFPVSTLKQRELLLNALDRVLSAGKPRRR